MATNWIMNFAVVQVTLPGIDSLGWKFWIIWAVICFAFIPITYFFYPETANRYAFQPHPIFMRKKTNPFEQNSGRCGSFLCDKAWNLHPSQ